VIWRPRIQGEDTTAQEPPLRGEAAVFGSPEFPECLEEHKAPSGPPKIRERTSRAESLLQEDLALMSKSRVHRFRASALLSRPLADAGGGCLGWGYFALFEAFEGGVLGGEAELDALAGVALALGVAVILAVSVLVGTSHGGLP
jgi:hypothetical protein